MPVKLSQLWMGGGDDQSMGQSLAVMKMIPIEGKFKVVNES
jgi:hypothetical protein